MQFVKNNWISLLCGVVGLVAVTVAVLGMMSDKVVTDMQARVSEAGRIRALVSNPQNEETIKAQKQQTEAFSKQYEETLNFAADVNKREPLLAGVFPAPGQPALGYRFKEEYERKLYELPKILNAGGKPTEQEVRNEQEILDDLARRKAQNEAENASPLLPVPGVPQVAPPTAAGGGRMPGGGRARGRGGRAAGQAVSPSPTAEGAPADQPAETLRGGSMTPEAELRAAVRKARNVPIYAEMNKSESCFHVSPIVNDASPPSPRDMWYAQLSLWVQQDIVRALRDVNHEAAQTLGDAEPSVTTSPVKRIVHINIDGYVGRQGTLVAFPAASAAGANQPGEERSGVSFTMRKSDEQFDVVQFTVRLIADERHLLQVVDALTRANFYQLIGISYVAVQPDNVRGDGYFYGPQPVVEVRLQFEGYLAHKVFKELMPKEVLVDIGAEQGEQPQGS